MPRSGSSLSRSDFHTAIERLAVGPSLVTRDRVCTGIAGGGAALDLEGLPGYAVLTQEILARRGEWEAAAMALGSRSGCEWLTIMLPDSDAHRVTLDAGDQVVSASAL